MIHFPDILRHWRKTRRFSQLQLATEADVSLRHLSFLETGRSRPSAEMVVRLGEAMELPLSARNQLLTAAGFAVRYPSRAWDDADMAPIRAAIDHMLTAHAPFPAMAVDRLWRIRRLNGPAAMLFGQLGLAEGDSLLDLMMTDVLPPLIENWPEVAAQAVLRLRTESAAQGGVVELDAAADHLAEVSGPDAPDAGPVIPTLYRFGALRLALFATIAQFGTPMDAALEDLKIELFFPADDATAETLRGLARPA